MSRIKAYKQTRVCANGNIGNVRQDSLNMLLLRTIQFYFCCLKIIFFWVHILIILNNEIVSYFRRRKLGENFRNVGNNEAIKHHSDVVQQGARIQDDTSSLDSTPIRGMPTPPQDESDMFKYIDKIAYLILNNLPLRLKHLIKLRKLDEVSTIFPVCFWWKFRVLYHLSPA